MSPPFSQIDFPEFIAEQADKVGLGAKNVILEVTETQLMQDIVTPLEILTRLRLKGVALSIDDFGTGYSSMEQLKRIPFTEMKIDRAFVNGAADNPAARAILESTVDLAKKLNMSIVAEGSRTRTTGTWSRNSASILCRVTSSPSRCPPMSSASGRQNGPAGHKSVHR